MIHIEKSHGGEGGKNEMNVEGEGDREGSDVSYPRGGGFYWAVGSRRLSSDTINWTKKVLRIR